MSQQVTKEKLYKISRLNKNYPNYNEIIKLHKEAIEEHNDIYIDPDTGFAVLTAEFYLNAGIAAEVVADIVLMMKKLSKKGDHLIAFLMMNVQSAKADQLF